MKIETHVFCDFCRTSVMVSPASVEKVDWQDKDTLEILSVTAFRCPNCGNLSLKHIDDRVTQSLLHMLLKLKVKAEKLREKGQCLNGADKKKMAMLDRKLNHKRSELLQRFGPAVDQFITKLESNEPSHEQILEEEEH